MISESSTTEDYEEGEIPAPSIPSGMSFSDPQKGVHRVMIVGDSQIASVEKNIRDGTRHFSNLMDLEQCEIYWMAHPEADLEWVRDIVLSTVSVCKPNIVFLHLGINDIAKGQSPTEVLQKFVLLTQVLLENDHVKHVLIGQAVWVDSPKACEISQVFGLNQKLTSRFHRPARSTPFHDKTTFVRYIQVMNLTRKELKLSQTGELSPETAIALYDGIRLALMKVMKEVAV